MIKNRNSNKRISTSKNNVKNTKNINILGVLITILIITFTFTSIYYWRANNLNVNNTVNNLTETQPLMKTKIEDIYDSSIVIDTEKDPVKNFQKISNRIDMELSKAPFTTLTGTDLELKIPTSFSIPTKINSQTFSSINLFQVTDKESDMLDYVLLCDYEYGQYPSVRKTTDEATCKKLLAKYTQKQLESYNGLNTSHNFFVHLVKTSVLPSEWVLDNVGYQGTNLRNQPKGVSRGTKVTINGFDYITFRVACCGGYEYNYFTQYQDLEGNKIILKFGTGDRTGDYITPYEGNIVLDKILATLRKKDK